MINLITMRHMVLSVAAVSFSFAAISLDAAPNQSAAKKRHVADNAQPATENPDGSVSTPAGTIKTSPEGADVDVNSSQPNENSQQNPNNNGQPYTSKIQPSKKIAQQTPAKSNDSYTMFKREPLKDPNAQDNAPTESLTLVEIASQNPSFTTLVKLLKTADLVNTLEGSGPFTIFAPNDAAFAKLSPNTLDDLQRPENKARLTGILTYHVVPGLVKASDLKAGSLKTINGKPLDVKVKGSEVTLNNAKVVKSDVIGKNGVIHVIDTVLLP